MVVCCCGGGGDDGGGGGWGEGDGRGRARVTPECSNPELPPAEHRSGLTTQTRSLQRLLDADGTSKDAGSHPEAFCLRPVTVMTASLQPESGR